MYPFGLGVIKISVLFLYQELFPSDNFRNVLFCVMGFIGAMTTACCVAFVFQCTPVHSYWVLSLWAPGDRHCVNEGALAIASSTLSMVTDIFILFLPLKYLLSMWNPSHGVGSTITDSFFSIEDFYEREDPSNFVDEPRRVVSTNPFFTS